MAKKAEAQAKTARNKAEQWFSYFSENINQYHYVTSFIMGHQWDHDEETMLKTYRKIPLVVNKLATLANSVLGEQMQNTPQLQVVPLDNCDAQTAEIREALVKELIFSSGAKTAYQEAAKQSLLGGFGAYAVLNDYAHENSFDQDIFFTSFKDPTKCYWDISADEINKTDGMHCGWVAYVSRQKFRDEYGKNIEQKIFPDSSTGETEAEVAMATSTNMGGSFTTWADENTIALQYHFTKKQQKEMLYKLSNGRTVTQDELDEIIASSQKINMEMMQQQMMEAAEQGEMPEDLPQMAEEMVTLYDDGEPVRIDDKKEIKKHIIRMQKFAGEYLLDESEFPSETLPLVFVDQNSYYDENGKQVCRPFLIDTLDTQKYLNYLSTQSAYILKVSRYDQWYGSKKNVQSQDTQRQWRDPAAMQGLLTFDESPNGITPQQVRPPELSQSLLTQYQRAMEDLYTGSGLYPTRMGQQGNETSGAAIDSRTRQGSYPTFTYFNSINRAIAKGGEIVNEMIPKIYDSTRVISLMMTDQGRKNIVINKQMDEYGEMIENDIRKGSYQVRLMPGPSYEGQKEQALQSLTMALQANPQLFNMVADLYAENLPLANTIELKNRFKTLVPPEILQASKTGEMPQQGATAPDPAVMAQMQQAQMQQQQLMMKNREIDLKQQELALKARDQQLSYEKEMQELEAQRIETAATLQGKELDYMAETHRTNTDAEVAHADNIAKILTHKPGFQ